MSEPFVVEDPLCSICYSQAWRKKAVLLCRRHNGIAIYVSICSQETLLIFTDKITPESRPIVWNYCIDSSAVRHTSTPPTTTPTRTSHPSIEDMAHHVVQTYICGHSECTPMKDVSGPQYVFIEGPCSQYLCSQTDVNSFKQQGQPPSDIDMNLLKKYSQQLTAFQKSAKSDVAKPFAVHPSHLKRVSDAGFPVLQQIAMAEDPSDYIDCLFHLSTLKSLLKYARGFAKSGKTRPFFDFCMCELAFFIEQATATEANLLDAFKMYSTLRKNPAGSSNSLQWPGARKYYEPDFGKKQLDTLRSMGPTMETYLQQPFSMSMLHQCELAVRNAA